MSSSLICGPYVSSFTHQLSLRFAWFFTIIISPLCYFTRLRRIAMHILDRTLSIFADERQFSIIREFQLILGIDSFLKGLFVCSVGLAVVTFSVAVFNFA